MEQPVDFEQAESMGVSRPAYDEVADILGHLPSLDELSTLLAMWDSNGRQQSLYGWLRGLHHASHRDDYLYTGSSGAHRDIREPRVRECQEIALQLASGGLSASVEAVSLDALGAPLLYMVGRVSTEFLGSDYARRCLHLVDEPMGASGNDEDREYIAMIASALAGSGLAADLGEVATGGLFGSLLRRLAPRGFDILAPREVRLDAFLFGEEPGRRLLAVDEASDDRFLLKLDEARVNACFLGRPTRDRILVDGFDFGPVSRFTPTPPTP